LHSCRIFELQSPPRFWFYWLSAFTI